MFTPYYSGLVAISSFRPHATGEVAVNQIRAKKSWDQVFDRILLFGPKEKELDSPITQFVECDNWPSISLMFWAASHEHDPVCILNADIVVALHLKDILNQGWAKRAMALTSRRYEFDPKTEDYNAAKVVDQGADFFCAFPSVWYAAYKAIPTGFRIGHAEWDSWTLSFLWQHTLHRFLNLEHLRPIFHPKHGDRNMPHHIVVPREDFPPSMGFPPAMG